jgi:hypothetical protein
MNDLPTTTAAAGDPNKYLQEAREIEITFGDRQAGPPPPSLAALALGATENADSGLGNVL